MLVLCVYQQNNNKVGRIRVAFLQWKLLQKIQILKRSVKGLLLESPYRSLSDYFKAVEIQLVYLPNVNKATTLLKDVFGMFIIFT